VSWEVQWFCGGLNRGQEVCYAIPCGGKESLISSGHLLNSKNSTRFDLSWFGGTCSHFHSCAVVADVVVVMVCQRAGFGRVGVRVATGRKDRERLGRLEMSELSMRRMYAVIRALSDRRFGLCSGLVWCVGLSALFVDVWVRNLVGVRGRRRELGWARSGGGSAF